MTSPTDWLPMRTHWKWTEMVNLVWGNRSVERRRKRRGVTGRLDGPLPCNFGFVSFAFFAAAAIVVIVVARFYQIRLITRQPCAKCV